MTTRTLAPTRVILNADDFGLHPAVNQAIERAYREGLVTSASLMILGDACDDAARRARAFPTLDIGLHFTMVGVSRFPPTLGAFLRAYFTGQFPARRVADALRRQLDLAILTHKLTITHLDSHQHLHALPSLMRIVCRVAAEYDIPGIRLPFDGPARAAVPPMRRAQAAALRAAARLSRRHIAAQSRGTTDHFAGMAVSGHLSPEVLAAYITSARPGTTEIVCHPGADNAALSALYPWDYDWQGELAAVCDPNAREAAGSNAVRLTTWRDGASLPWHGGG